jgi:hypothetical protein
MGGKAFVYHCDVTDRHRVYELADQVWGGPMRVTREVPIANMAVFCRFATRLGR